MAPMLSGSIAAFPRSRRHEAIESRHVIFPIGIAEIERTVSECAVLQRNTCRMGKVSAGFNHHWDIRCAGDGESKSIRAQSKAAIADLDSRIPQNGRTAAEGRVPAGGAGKEIDGRVIVQFE